MEIKETDIIGEVVAKDYRTASIFKRMRIDFCCNGNRTIKTAIENKLDRTILLKEINELTKQTAQNQIYFNAWPLDLLIDYIEKTHHRYVESKINEIKPFLGKVVKVHGNNHPELVEIQAEFLKSAGELSMHMKKEELVLFPYINKMVLAKEKGEKVDPAHFGSVENPVEMMMQEHDTEGVRFRRISKLSNSYNPPQDACNTYRVTYAMLRDFEENLHQHIHLENNILFPRAIEMESDLNNKFSNSCTMPSCSI
ncbi:MAG: iron-sulfur cluster repair di-iron protein [Flavobacteriales bacterium]|nr:iron-sulfur cluster repair di-iron protein [Flavobacteriales bacterium]